MSAQLQTYFAIIKAHPILTTLASAATSATLIAYLDYRAYISLGPHGLPDTFQGWLRQLRMSRNARKDVTVPAPYDIDSVAGPHDKQSFLPQSAADGVLHRLGNKAPTVPGFVAPQRQTTEQASEAMKRDMFAYLDILVAANSSVLQTQTSVLEGPVPALGMKNFKALNQSTRPQVLEKTRGEMCHIHPPDGSTHLILSLADQRTLIELGWGRRHRLSGGGLLPWNYTFLYAPRDDKEYEVWKKIVVASAKFCCADEAEVKMVGGKI